VSKSRISHIAGVARIRAGAGMAGIGAAWIGQAIDASSSASALAPLAKCRFADAFRPLLNRIQLTGDPPPFEV